MRPTERREGAGAGRGPGTVVGVAGIMGAGKSTVARVFERLGAVRIDADELGRALVVDAALLPEWGGHAWVDFLIVVDSDEEACVSRMVKHSRFREGAVRARMACQLSREDKKRYADLVIINDGTQEELIQKAEQAYETVLGLGERSQ
jgi:dephospho-CoA kinase